MVRVGRNHKFDFENKTYIFSSKLWGVRILKHFSFQPCGSRSGQTMERWRFVTLDGSKISNVLITEPLNKCCFVFDTPEAAIMDTSKYEPTGVFYELEHGGMFDFFPPE
jgi:hypothetical protein